MRKLVLCVGALAALMVFGVREAGADECWIDTPPGYQRIGGASRIGPYPDWYAANRVNNQYFNGQGSISCTGSSGGGGATPRFRYGAAKLHNRTSGTISVRMRTSPGGSWASATIESGHWYWWWQACPCRFHAMWDGSFRSGYQRRYQEVNWYGYAHKPSASDARDWQFVQRGDRIDLVTGSSAPIPKPQAAPKPKPRPKPQPKPKLPNTLSFTGEGTGHAHAKDFRTSKVASGTWKLDFLPRVRGMIPTLQGTWRLQWKRFVGDPKAEPRAEVWNLSLSGFRGPGRNRQTVDLRMVGGAGTASYFTTRVPLFGSDEYVKLKVHVQFSGRNVRLSFTRAY